MAIFRRDPEIPFFDCGVIDPNPHPENIGGKIEKARARVVDSAMHPIAHLAPKSLVYK